MRTLFTLGLIVAAMLVPWSSLAPSWLPDASGSAPASTPPKRNPGPSARLNAALGILPVTADESGDLDVDQNETADSNGFQELVAAISRMGQPSDSGKDKTVSRVVCENGVCKLVDEPAEGSSKAAEMAGKRQQAVLQKLQSLGAMQVRTEKEDDAAECRASCCLPIRPDSSVMKWFKATGVNETEAWEAVLAQIESWLEDR